ncbi:hypothetical protein [Bradyrhizobium sp. UFLA05-112]
MAPRRKKASAPPKAPRLTEGSSPGKEYPSTRAFEMAREFKLRLPPDLSEWVERKALITGQTQSRVMVNGLASLDHLEKVQDFGELLEHFRTTLAKYSARIVVADLSDDLLRAVDAVLEATDGELQARLDKLRVIRGDMQKHERVAKE